MRSSLLLTAAVSALVGSATTVLLSRHLASDAGGPLHTATDSLHGSRPAHDPVAHSATGRWKAPPQQASYAMDDRQAKERARVELDALARTFTSEAVDVAWSASTERHLAATMSSDIMIASEIVPDDLDVKCRSSLCRVRARFGKYNDASDWGMMLVTAAGETFGRAMPVVTPGPDGHAYLEMYALRK
jgi:hypothetical protein